MNIDEDQLARIQAYIAKAEAEWRPLAVEVDQLETQIRKLEQQAGGKSGLTIFAELCLGENQLVRDRLLADAGYNIGAPSPAFLASSLVQANPLRETGLLNKITNEMLAQQKDRENAENTARLKSFDICSKLLAAPELHQTENGKAALDTCYQSVIESRRQ